MKKAIIDYKKVTPELLLLLQERYPGGYRDRDIIIFDDHHNNTIEAVEVKTSDTIYLIKVSSKLHYTMTNIDNDSDELEEIVPDDAEDFSEE
ncbi:hypothetical protein IMCC3317_03630 [Kordia antarctica]|uniref:DNA primase n=1 Tax=Kordia antarctica TaxID=1218801 RepID=A0A7L4ZEL3_9FLAO|nr:hypothetical protein [Kordia antarctica]QHI35017.1 hypothetical protein IMCC3317_03630 [Kordia antarctica]